jgi:acetyl-CoA decarbonylase/synthase complex subunit gamma
VGLPSLNQPFVSGFIPAPIGQVPRVYSELAWADRLGSWKARWGIGRMRYTVEPGLYALGAPDRQSPVLVTANYKMSLDRLRQALPGRSAWILVLDTKGINVWCAAGKGTFGTTELIERIAASGLNDAVSHRELILPQLAGPGVAAHQVKKATGFRVQYGPIRAEDLPAFLDGGNKALPEMRVKTFALRERAVLIPMELVSAVKWALVMFAALSVLSGLLGPGGFWPAAKAHGSFVAAALAAAVLSGGVLTQIFLPWLPGRAFSLKGLWPSLLLAVVLFLFQWEHAGNFQGRLEGLSWLLLIPALASYLAMNFTGASTYTSLSGVRKEMRCALPLQIGAGVMGLGLWVSSLLIS